MCIITKHCTTYPAVVGKVQATGLPGNQEAIIGDMMEWADMPDLKSGACNECMGSSPIIPNIGHAFLEGLPVKPCYHGDKGYKQSC